MKACAAIVAALLSVMTGVMAAENTMDVALEEADYLFARGSVAAARQRYEALLKSAPNSPDVIERLGYVCHVTGEYKRAIELFDKAISLNPGRRTPILAYSVYPRYMLRDYAGALRVLRELESTGYQYKTAFFSTEQLQHLVENPPYRTDGRVDRTTVTFESLDPLPVVAVRIKSRVVHALIDTGAPQLLVDPAFAAEEHIKLLSEQISRGTGGRPGQKVGFAVAESVMLGNLEVRNVPVMLLPVRNFSKLFGVQIDAVLGTETLAQFLPTLDFPGRKLILRTKTKANREEVQSMKAKARLPFVLDDIHSMYAQCRVNEKEPVLLYFDTGVVDEGASILTGKDRLIQLGIPVPSDSKSGFADIQRVRVGSLERTHVRAVYGPGKQLAYCQYIQPYGLIGHNYLKHYRWTIDFDNRLFLFDY